MMSESRLLLLRRQLNLYLRYKKRRTPPEAQNIKFDWKNEPEQAIKQIKED